MWILFYTVKKSCKKPDFILAAGTPEIIRKITVFLNVKLYGFSVFLVNLQFFNVIWRYLAVKNSIILLNYKYDFINENI